MNIDHKDMETYGYCLPVDGIDPETGKKLFRDDDAEILPSLEKITQITISIILKDILIRKLKERKNLPPLTEDHGEGLIFFDWEKTPQDKRYQAAMIRFEIIPLLEEAFEDFLKRIVHEESQNAHLEDERLSLRNFLKNNPQLLSQIATFGEKIEDFKKECMAALRAQYESCFGLENFERFDECVERVKSRQEEINFYSKPESLGQRTKEFISLFMNRSDLETLLHEPNIPELSGNPLGEELEFLKSELDTLLDFAINIEAHLYPPVMSHDNPPLKMRVIPKSTEEVRILLREALNTFEKKPLEIEKTGLECAQIIQLRDSLIASAEVVRENCELSFVYTATHLKLSELSDEESDELLLQRDEIKNIQVLLERLDHNCQALSEFINSYKSWRRVRENPPIKYIGISLESQQELRKLAEESTPKMQETALEIEILKRVIRCAWNDAYYRLEKLCRSLSRTFKKHLDDQDHMPIIMYPFIFRQVNVEPPQEPLETKPPCE